MSRVNDARLSMKQRNEGSERTGLVISCVFSSFFFPFGLIRASLCSITIKPKGKRKKEHNTSKQDECNEMRTKHKGKTKAKNARFVFHFLLLFPFHSSLTFFSFHFNLIHASVLLHCN